MRRLLMVTLCLSAVTFAGYWSWNHRERIFDVMNHYIDNGDFLTLEARYSAEQIMKAHSQELLVDESHQFQKPSLKFYPYLLIEAKYSGDDRKTHEGVILWSMVDGEMILNTHTWECTHGFQDAMLVGATREEFRIMNALAAYGGSLTRDQLQKELRLEFETFEPWIDSARDKRLIIQQCNELKLHVEKPKIRVTPQTRINQWLVTKPYRHVQRIAKRFSRKQIENTAQAAFGSDFTIRSVKEVALPIYSIGVLNPDGSVRTTFWNALNGQKIQPGALAYRRS